MAEGLRRPTRDLDKLLADVARLVRESAPNLADPDRASRFVNSYFKHALGSSLLARPAEQVARGLAHHVGYARRRQPGESVVQLFTPVFATDGWDANGYTVLTVVSDDKTWLVDTINIALVGQGWAVREVVHPQLSVVRDEHGEVVDFVTEDEPTDALAEAWVWTELYPPLGQSAEEAMPALRQALERGLADLDAATRDRAAMQARMIESAGLAAAVDHPDAAITAEMLHWLADDRFVVLGTRDFDVLDERTRFVPRPGGLGILREDARAARAFSAAPLGGELLLVLKDSERARVWRSIPMDYIGLHLPGPDGGHLERRFLGLFAASALSESVTRVPVLREKAQQITRAIGYDPDSHGGRAIAAAIEAHPREELLQSTVEELVPVIAEVAGQDHPRRVMSFLRRGRYGRFLTALIYLPRERYNTVIRQRIEEMLREATGAEASQFSVLIGDSPMARLYVTLQMPAGQRLPQLDGEQLRVQLEEVSRSWDARFFEIAERMDSSQRGVEFPEGYKDEYTPVEAISDLVSLNQLDGPSDMAQIMYVPSPPENGVDFRLKVMRLGSEMVLSQVLPHLASLGVDVIDERPFDVELRGEQAHVYDFGLRLPGGPERLNGWSYAARSRFTSALAASYSGLCEADGLNRLVTDSQLSWQQVSVLRAISRYLRQLGTTYSQPYIAATLNKHNAITVDLMALFDAKFNPWLPGDGGRQDAVDELTERVLAGVDQVSSLDEDRMLRQYLAVITAMVRTNFYALGDDKLPSGAPCPSRGALAFKLMPSSLDFVAGRAPLYEVFVYSPQVEGVHVRFSKVARGGLRWSDRAEDYRTEVLDLAAAQTVKNAIIVPGGAKGGFYPLRAAGLEGSARIEEGRASYAAFVTAMLSITDNIVDGEAVGPRRVVRWDDEDPYLVVAADKGTASFSDLANEIAARAEFWLGDAFASGGSHGYDHKRMGITARGAWVSVERHFAELGIDPSADHFSCIGIGDMSGDVFGNGLLLSRHVKLVAAFNHRHIFLDPDPDPTASFLERERLFKLARSGWHNYRAEAISEGGGVFLRTAKSIPVSPQVRSALGVPDEVTELTPNEMIRTILRAPVDLFWNGGVGTYVKASHESNSSVGDRGNDAVRVDGSQVRARCVAEGGNLGWTHDGRVEYALAGGRINTDFIDNSAGVSISDQEVNIKILLNGEVKAGRLALDDRNALLQEMTDELAGHVLAQNVAQNRALANSLYLADQNLGVHEDLIASLEREGQLDRMLDGLPSGNDLTARGQRGQGLVGPELATLLALVKNALAAQVLATDLPDDPYLADRLVEYFPSALRRRCADLMPSHRLAREIITTEVVNDFVDSQGISAAHRLQEETTAHPADVVRGQLVARDLMDAAWFDSAIADADVSAHVRTRLRVDLRSAVERATRWLLQQQVSGVQIGSPVTELKPGVTQLLADLPSVLTEAGRARVAQVRASLLDENVPPQLAERVAGLSVAPLVPSIVRVATREGHDLTDYARVYFALSERLGIDKALEAALRLPKSGRWDIMARASVRDELINAQAAVAADALELADGHDLDTSQVVEVWWDAHPLAAHQQQMLIDLEAGEADLARISVVVGALRTLLHR